MKKRSAYRYEKFFSKYIGEEIEDGVWYRGNVIPADMNIHNPYTEVTSLMVKKENEHNRLYIDDGTWEIVKAKPIGTISGLSIPKIVITPEFFEFKHQDDMEVALAREVGAYYMHSLRRIVDKTMQAKFFAVGPCYAQLTSMINALSENPIIMEPMIKKLSHARHSLTKVKTEKGILSREYSWALITETVRRYHDDLMPVWIPHENKIIIIKNLEQDLFAIANEGLQKFMKYRRRNMGALLPEYGKYDPTHYFISNYYIRMLNSLIREIGIEKIEKIYKLP